MFKRCLCAALLALLCLTVPGTAEALPLYTEEDLAQGWFCEAETLETYMGIRLEQLGYADALEEALIHFQQRNGLEPTGVPDDATLLTLFNAGAIASDGSAAEAFVPEEPHTYIGNRKTKKFHETDCSSVDQIKESNRVELESREEAIEAGYVPCKNCNP